VGDQDPAQGGRDDDRRRDVAQAIGELGAETPGLVRVLEDQRRLEIDPGVEARREAEVPAEQGALRLVEPGNLGLVGPAVRGG